MKCLIFLFLLNLAGEVFCQERSVHNALVIKYSNYASGDFARYFVFTENSWKNLSRRTIEHEGKLPFWLLPELGATAVATELIDTIAFLTCCNDFNSQNYDSGFFINYTDSIFNVPSTKKPHKVRTIDNTYDFIWFANCQIDVCKCSKSRFHDVVGTEIIYILKIYHINLFHKKERIVIKKIISVLQSPANSSSSVFEP